MAVFFPILMLGTKRKEHRQLFLRSIGVLYRTRVPRSRVPITTLTWPVYISVPMSMSITDRRAGARSKPVGGAEKRLAAAGRAGARL